MYSSTFKAYEEKAKAAGLKVQTEIASDGICRALKLTLSDGTGKCIERYEDILSSVTEAHERVYVEALGDFFGEASIHDEVGSIEDVVQTEEISTPESINEGFALDGYGTGFLLDGIEDVSGLEITTPIGELTEETVPRIMPLSTQADFVDEPEGGEYGSDFESTARAFAKESDRHFSALISKQRTKDLIVKLMRMDKINDKAALETKEKGLAYLKVHGIAL